MADNEAELEQTQESEKAEEKAEEKIEEKVEEKVEEKAEEKGKKSSKVKDTSSAGTKSLTKDELVAAVRNMTVVELVDLVKALEEEFGVTAAAPVAVAAAGTPAAGGAAPAATDEEQTEFTVILKEIGENKINVIKAVREVTTLGLKEAKDLVEAAPKPVKEGVNKDEANAMKQKLQEAGATVEVK